MKTPKIHDGDRVRTQMAKHEITQATLSKHLGVSPSTLSRMLNESSWRTDHLADAGELLGCNFLAIYAKSALDDGPVIGIIIDPAFLKDSEIFQKIRNQMKGDEPENRWEQ